MSKETWNTVAAWSHLSRYAREAGPTCGQQPTRGCLAVMRQFSVQADGGQDGTLANSMEQYGVGEHDAQSPPDRVQVHVLVARRCNNGDALGDGVGNSTALSQVDGVLHGVVLAVVQVRVRVVPGRKPAQSVVIDGDAARLLTCALWSSLFQLRSQHESLCHRFQSTAPMRQLLPSLGQQLLRQRVLGP